MDLDSLPKSYKKTFSHYLTLFKCIGIEFFDEPKSYFTWKNFKFACFCITFFPFIAGQFSLIGKIRAHNFMETSRVVPVDVMFLIDIVKLSIAILKKSQIRDMFLEIGEMWPKDIDSGDQRSAVLRRYLRGIRLPLDLFLVYGYANLGIYEVIPGIIYGYYYFVEGVKVFVFPFQTVNSWASNNDLTFFVTYLWQVVSCTYFLLCNTALAVISLHHGLAVPSQICFYLPFDLTIATMTSNISALLRLVQEDLQNAIILHDEKKLKKNIHKTDPESYEKVLEIVQLHQRLLRLADKLTDIYGIVIFIHVAFASVEICFFGFLTVVYGGLADTIANLLTVMSAVFTIFVLSLSGQTLCDTSTEVADAAYQSLWYESDANVKRLMLFIIIRAQRPNYLSALGFSQLTLTSFTKIMSTSWTYFSLLIQLYGDI